jgi:hypothetical protein|tara:strand:- start:9315 stop:9731 length:417 start_codon:yes stop_codon:yes gene_type:complete
VSFEDERAAIERRFGANYSATDVKYENVPFTQPERTSWVALTILSGSGTNESIGTGMSSRLERFAGIIQIDVYTVEDGGTGAARNLADTIGAIFDNVQFSHGSSGTITTRVPSYSTRGIEDGWHHSVVSVAYHRSKFS